MGQLGTHRPIGRGTAGRSPVQGGEAPETKPLINKGYPVAPRHGTAAAIKVGDTGDIPQTDKKREDTMLRWAFGFFILALIAAVLGFGGIAGSAVVIAKWLFVGFLVLAAVTVVANAMSSR